MQGNTSSVSVRSFGKTAFVMSNAIGDTLVSMIIVRNLIKNGIQVTVFGGPAFALRTWFPDVTIAPLPSLTEIVRVLADFDTVMQMQADQPVRALQTLHPHVVNLHDVEFGKHEGCMGQRFVDFCRRELALPDTDLYNGVKAPSGLQHRKYMQRVLIHPEASTPDKRWTQQRYIKLAQQLGRRGYEVHFVIAPHEQERWVGLGAQGISAPHFPNLAALAEWLYESGWFIGNDSGIGHLASNLGIPMLSLFRRRNVSKRWRPVWGQVSVVLPWQWVPSAFLKEMLWRQTLTCARVLKSFSRLQIMAKH